MGMDSRKTKLKYKSSWNLKINICFVTPCYQFDNSPTGGLPIHYRSLAEELAKRDHKVTVIFADRFNGLSGNIDKNLNFKSIKFGFPKILHSPIISRLITQLGLSEKIRFFRIVK